MRAEFDSAVVIGEDIVVSVLCPVEGKVGNIRRELGSHVYRTKLLQEKLVVIGLHDRQLVQKTHHWNR